MCMICSVNCINYAVWERSRFLSDVCRTSTDVGQNSQQAVKRRLHKERPAHVLFANYCVQHDLSARAV